MFNKKVKTETILADRTYSVISQGLILSGEINTKDDLRIDGTVDGNINCEGKVIVGPTGCVKGNIESESIELMGKVNGNIIVHDIIMLKSSSYYDGDITAVSIDIEAGANFFGNCRMSDVAKPEHKPILINS
ncbi:MULTISPECIES: polymer-forming cytoskeletal protein [unclassified Dysgonomonas]|uniref:bactofilin family protein n=1 Tax=unclassified Dysgonomonas TaxID=2630389 RepID=UPI0006812613|nr:MULTISPECIES: polymer-forming cytoskeletal protein [unclassified Dysgonomonas]MBD8346879.1 polymer-forming cytoskeletal protein [Dysgonomonas sp. HGC4]MBF0575191.1 polymer-forming cytoskeletal protein [Dysgonomonas sp. GY617]